MFEVESSLAGALLLMSNSPEIRLVDRLMATQSLILEDERKMGGAAEEEVEVEVGCCCCCEGGVTTRTCCCGC